MAFSFDWQVIDVRHWAECLALKTETGGCALEHKSEQTARCHDGLCLASGAVPSELSVALKVGHAKSSRLSLQLNYCLYVKGRSGAFAITLFFLLRQGNH